MSVGHDLLGGPPPTFLPIDTGAVTALAASDPGFGSARLPNQLTGLGSPQ